ncbi:MAG: hypothetical protein E6H67_08590 [Betaproteobacteria bacterium]|nr:MAG: hypothetical protein E6H67_08590 [Betaproteobacteria bacterium]
MMHDVTIGSIGFSPSTVTIKAGEGSPTLSGGQSFFRVFASKGTVGYHCHIHHEMTATVVVT